MPLDLIRRLVKGSPLTAAEHDGNLDEFESAIEAITPSPDDFTALTYAATVNIDMAALHGQTRVITLAGNLSVTFTNMAAGRWVALRLICDATQRALTFPSGLVFYERSAAPANIAANKEAKFSVEFYGTTASSGRAGYVVQP